MIAPLVLALALQGLSDRVAGAPDGEVRFHYATRPGVCGNGRNVISLECEQGSCGRHRISSGSYYDDAGDCACTEGPARVALAVRGGKITRVRVFVGGEERSPGGAAVTDLGAVSAAAATRFLLDVAARAGGEVGRDALFPTILADSVTVWPDLLRLARDTRVAQETRRSAVFWLGQAAGEAATRGLSDLVDADDVDLAVKESAVFALSQRPHDEGVPALIRIARSHHSPSVRKKALFWLGQTNDPRAIALFEELLTRP